MGRKISLYLILGLVLIGFCVAPVAATGSVALPNGDSWYETDGNYAYYYHSDTGIWDTIHQTPVGSEGLTIYSIPKVTPSKTNSYSNSLLPKTNPSTIITKPLPTQGTIKTIPAVKYEPATPLVTPTITLFTYSPSKGATTIPSIKVSNIGLKSTSFFSLKQYQTLNQKADTSTSSTYQNLDDYYNAIEAYKINLSPIQRKIDLVILSLFLDPNYPKYANEDLSMQRAGTVIPALELGPNGGAFGDAVQVYIDLEPGATSDDITPYLYSLMGKSPDSNRYAAIVPLKNIYSLASLDDVLRISLVAPGILADSR